MIVEPSILKCAEDPIISSRRRTGIHPSIADSKERDEHDEVIRELGADFVADSKYWLAG